MMQKHSISRAAAGARWNPRDGLIGGDQGLWLDPSDLTTLLQDSAGTTPVTAVEQPVGLMLDKSKGLTLGPELVANGNFDANIDGWAASGPATLTWSAGQIRVTKNATGNWAVARQNITVTIGRTYKLRCNYSNPSGATIHFYFGGTASNWGTATSGVIEFYAVPTVSNPLIEVGFNLASGAVGAYIEFDNISVRELPGNHAFQSTSANRPTLSARYNQYVGTEAMATQNVTTLATSYKLIFSGAGSITLSGTATGTYTAGTYTVTCTAGTLTSTVSGSVTQASLVPANQSSLPYQRVNTATDYDSDATKFPRRINYAAGQSMTVNLPANLGSSCVVARANPGVSAVIAENQTVNTPLTLNTSHSGLVITSRSISVDEKARLDEYLDKKAIAK